MKMQLRSHLLKIPRPVLRINKENPIAKAVGFTRLTRQCSNALFVKTARRAATKRYKQCSNALTYTSKRYKRYKRYTF